MKWVPDGFYNFYRKHFGSYTLEDPRPIAQSSPYTYYIPPADHIAALRPGDIAKLIFLGQPGGRQFNGERMWVKVTGRDGQTLIGALDNEPFDMPQLAVGDEVHFEPHNVIAIEYENADQRPELNSLSEPTQKQYWDRCLVDDCVQDGSVRVGYLYREAPDMAQEDDEYSDSGWRIRGDVSRMSDEQYESGGASYIALGAVLNKDDSWLHLIDSPHGTAFLINPDTGEFEPTEFTADRDDDDDETD